MEEADIEDAAFSVKRWKVERFQLLTLNAGVGLFVTANSVFIIHISEMTQFAMS